MIVKSTLDGGRRDTIRPLLEHAGKFCVRHDPRNPVDAYDGARLSKTYSTIGLPATRQQRLRWVTGFSGYRLVAVP